MKKILMVAVAATAVSATPALADNNVSIVTTATVAPACQASAFIRAVSADTSSGVGVGYDPTTQTTGNTTATSVVSLDTASPQLLGSITARCNTGTATLNLTTDNGFKLQNGAGGANREVPYTLNVSGSGGGTGIAAAHTGTLGGTGPAAQQSRSVSFVLAAPVNPILLAPGAYSDTLRVTFTPNP